MAGPAMIGFIPVCMVGALIFMLGFELLQEAVWDPLGKLHKLEYLTVCFTSKRLNSRNTKLHLDYFNRINYGSL